MRPRLSCFLLLLFGFTGVFSTTAHPQSMEYSCKHFFHLHQGIDCVEALFSEDPFHLVFGSVPPGNGVAIGAVWQKPIHFVSPFAPAVTPDMRDSAVFPLPKDPGTKETDRGGYKSLLLPRLGAAASTNGSWYLTGSADWLPGIYKDAVRTRAPLKPGLQERKTTCHEFFILCTESVLGIHFEGTHRVARTISFYGLGPASPPVKSTFRLDETYGSVQARMPIVDTFTFVAGVEGRFPNLPVESHANSVFTNFTAATLPGLISEPAYVHSNLGFTTQARHIYEAVTQESDDSNVHLPLLKHRTAISAKGEFAYHWYSDASGNSSFQQLTAGTDVAIELGAVTQRYVNSTSVSGFWSRTFYRVVEHYCGGPPADPRTVTDKKQDAEQRANAAEQKKSQISFEIKPRDRCDFGTLNFRAHLVTSRAATSNVIPFYMLPTVGGQDIDSRVSLRGFDNYRFRGADATFFQVEYTLPVYDPFGALVFYDAGNAGNTLSNLAFGHLRQDAGFGINIRILRMPVAQIYLAGGRGAGLHPGFNLVKQF